MTTRTLEAVYEHGVLRPLTPLHLREGETVQVTVESTTGQRVDALELAGRVLDGLTEAEIEEFESHLKRPMSMFELPSERIVSSHCRDERCGRVSTSGRRSSGKPL